MTLSDEANEVLNRLAAMSQVASEAVTRKLLREILLYTNGTMFLRGTTWDVDSIELGVGIYRVSLTRRMISQ